MNIAVLDCSEDEVCGSDLRQHFRDCDGHSLIKRIKLHLRWNGACGFAIGVLGTYVRVDRVVFWGPVRHHRGEKRKRLQWVKHVCFTLCYLHVHVCHGNKTVNDYDHSNTGSYTDAWTMCTVLK